MDAGDGRSNSTSPPRAQSATGPALDRTLGGELPCIACRYDLRGQSVLGVCPECGTLVRATILSIVDPAASELQPIRKPWLVAGSLLVWSISALAACILVWRDSLLDVYALATDARSAGAAHGAWSTVCAMLVVISGLAALGFARPHAAVAAKHTMMAITSGLLALPLAWIVIQLANLPRDMQAPGLTPIWLVAPQRTMLRVGGCMLIASMILLMRPIARLLVARSLAMRQGRVDRQTLYAMAIAAGMMAVGDLAGFIALRTHGASEDLYHTAALIVMALGWMLLTIGLVGSVVDCVRIARAVLTPSKTLEHLLEPEPSAPRTEAPREAKA
jgi:hypothetical protein